MASGLMDCACVTQFIIIMFLLMYCNQIIVANIYGVLDNLKE